MHVNERLLQFDTPHGEATIEYIPPTGWSDPRVSMVAVQCPGYIVWDNGKWWPEPQVVDYVLPRARAFAEFIGVPRYEWLHEIRRGDIWAIEKEFQKGVPVSAMMNFIDDPDYNGKYEHRQHRYSDSGGRQPRPHHDPQTVTKI